jgi:acyl-coenzyme A thioesterase PaaI-like protein
MTLDKDKILEYCKTFSKNTLMETLNIEFVDAGEGFLVAKMPVNASVHQLASTSVALAESVGSAASQFY